MISTNFYREICGVLYDKEAGVEGEGKLDEIQLDRPPLVLPRPPQRGGRLIFRHSCSVKGGRLRLLGEGKVKLARVNSAGILLSPEQRRC